MESQHYVNLLRRMRHDYANQVQVLGGWLELGDWDRACEALSVLRGSLQRDQLVLRHPIPEVALYLYECVQQAADLDIVLICDVSDFSSWESLQQGDQPLTELRRIRKDYRENELIIYLSITEQEQGVHLWFTIEDGRSRRLTIPIV